MKDDDSDVAIDVAHIHLDENVLPPGCDQELYEEAFSLRAKKHELQLVIRIAEQMIEDSQKILDEHKTSMIKVDKELKGDQENLDSLLVRISKIF